MKVTTCILLFLLVFTSIYSQSFDLKSPTQQYDYVVITKTSFAPLFDDFVSHKENVKSLTCTVVGVDQIYSEFPDLKYHKNSIREFISFAGKNWPEPQPKYFFIAGDVDAIPNFEVLGVRETDTAYTDYYYSVDIDSDDDTNIDYYVGRISARTSVELTNYLSKVISYESTPLSDWNSNIMIATQDNEGTNDLFDQASKEFAASLFEYLKPEVFHSPSNYNAFELQNSIINGINIKGYSSVFVWGLQSTNEQFGDPLVLDKEVIANINTSYYPFVSFLGPQKYSGQLSSSMLDDLLFNPQGAIGGYNVLAPNYVGLMEAFYTDYVQFLYSGTGNSIAVA